MGHWGSVLAEGIANPRGLQLDRYAVKYGVVNCRKKPLASRSAKCSCPVLGVARQVEPLTRLPHPIPYQGSKRGLAPLIVPYVPANIGAWFEPFAGSAAIESSRRASKPCQALYDAGAAAIFPPGTNIPKAAEELLHELNVRLGYAQREVAG